MKILIIGTWQKHKAITCKAEAEHIGKLLAERGHILMSGGGTGISELVANAYRNHNGKKYIAYFPASEEMERVGEEQGPEPDEKIQTDLDYPGRNCFMVKECDAVIALHGGLGALTEAIHAVKDYGKKVVVIDKGEFASWIKAIPELKEKVFLSPDVEKAIDFL